MSGRSLRSRSYLWPIFIGMWITARHLFFNLFHMRCLPTIQYPEQRRNYSPRFRGLHILTVKQNGDIRCTACMLCATACPAACIHITADEHPDPNVEKYPREFNIDMLRCVFCGMCEEACPVDAIRMGPGYELAGFDRNDFIYTKDDLVKNGNNTLSHVTHH
ncbi:MAG: NADH-quinone oxidoreductase subunit I [Deltaproteobacteria bacterium]|nr:NADH-quinone oxidoreductase subunit I [Deltaproteobacteria bacterium]MBI3296030.1 NADH-quinone oxidoreductase subunit I [Deltaproteobacteria bacterium]